MVTTGQVLSLEIEKPAAGGRMIARVSGQVVLVAGVIPGERARVRIEKVGKGVAYGVAVAIEQPSPARREPLCDPACGGSLYAHIAYDEQRVIKAAVIADALTRIARLPWPTPVAVAASPDAGYRMRARLHIRNGRLGFFRDGSHHLCDARPTAQLLPESVDAVEAAARAVGASDLEHVEVELSENVPASGRAVHFDVARGQLSGAAIPLMSGVTGVSVGNSERSSRVDVLAGDPHVIDDLAIDGGTFTLRRHVTAFFQGNRFLLQSLLTHVTGMVADGGAAVADLYAGVGLFSVAIGRTGRSVVAVEGDRIAAADLRHNAQQSGAAIEVMHLPVESFQREAGEALSTVIVDPPRTGMSREALKAAIGLNASTMVYVSCDVATLARDLRVLVDSGYAVRRIDAFDLFPNTPHVETVVVLDR